MKETLIGKLENRSVQVTVVGLGYVGLPLAVALAGAGYRTVGLDLDSEKVAMVNRGESYIDDVSTDRLQQLISGTIPMLSATTDVSCLADTDAVSVCVPTPLGKTGDPDISYIVGATRDIRRHLHPGMVVVLESTTFPGTTRDVVLTELTSGDAPLAVGQDFFLAFSPERIDPGREDWTLETMPKVLGGITEDCCEVAGRFYAPAVGPLVRVSSADAAEMVKLYENTFRAVNIALANELLLICDRLNLNAWEILDAAATKPFGFMKFTPGPGLGGHCIPVDPHYLSWKMRSLEYTARFIDLAHEINAAMPSYWVQIVQDRLNDVGLPVKGSHLLVLGVAYKKNVGDIRESPALDILELLEQKGARVQFHDPHVASLSQNQVLRSCIPDLTEGLKNADAVIIVTDHDAYNWPDVERLSRIVIDTRHVLPERQAMS